MIAGKEQIEVSCADELSSMNTERVPTPGERELSRYREEIRALHARLRIEETIERLKVIGAEAVKADTEASEVIIDGERCGSRRIQ